ncbi:N-acetylmuramoyl-L-alanine amidase-like domain-containing protein, partial [Nocardia higoensis]|uniref:N-acetylmuramoyl-L-alanine amidase-like domain-containing protein n=1 Tax=Nocardia higoensis TaxID=228599 RepID=UPI00278BBA33
GLPKGELLEALFATTARHAVRREHADRLGHEPEQLVIDLRRVDCFTYLDYVEALSRANDRDEFVRALVETRYTGGQVDFTHRKHFFTDWAHTDRIAATDVTASLSPAAVTVTEHLNAKADGSVYLPGLPVVERDLTYIPSERVDRDVLAGLRTGDYLGAYAGTPGLDVTHVGIVVRAPDGGLYFRNASSLAGNDAVVDSPLADYVATVPGIIVLRPL